MKLTFFSENKFHDRKESSLTKYYCIRRKLTVIKTFLTFSFKRAAKLHFMHYSCMVTTLFNTDLNKSAFSKLVFFSLFCVFFVCSVLNSI